MWGEMSGINFFIDDSSLDSDGSISMHLCDYKQS